MAGATNVPQATEEQSAEVVKLQRVTEPLNE